MTSDAPLYPDDQNLGELRTWDLPLQADRTLTVRGRFLGLGSSFQTMHTHQGDIVPDGRRCLACRWFEARIFREENPPHRYLLYHVGMTDVPGETDRISYLWTADAYEAVFAASMPHDTDSDRRYLPGPALRMMNSAVKTEADNGTDELSGAMDHYRVGSRSSHGSRYSRSNWNT